MRAAFSGQATPDDDIVEELAQHAEATYQAALAQGASADEAARSVDEELRMERVPAGRLRRQRSRPAAVEPPQPGARGLLGLGGELRYTVRRLMREPRHSVLAVLTLAVGIGGTTVLFSAVNGVLLAPLPWPEPGRLVRLSETREGATREWPFRITNGTYLALCDGTSSLESVAAWRDNTMTLSGDGDPERLRVVSVTASLFPMLGARAEQGSIFGPADEAAGDALVLSYALWQRRFGSRPDVIGRLLSLDGRLHRVVGVMGRGFQFPDERVNAWAPLHVLPAVRPDGSPAGLSTFSALARLRPGATPERAAEEATVRARHAPDPGLVTMVFFGTRGAPRVSVTPALDALTADVRPALLILLAAIGLLLAAAAANVASLLLVRATVRRRELAVRSALGAGAGRLARLLLVESATLGALGGLVGFALAAATLRIVPAALPAGFPRIEGIAVDLRVVAFSAVLALATGLAAGTLPALFTRRLSIAAVLQEEGPASAAALRSGAARARTLILAGQVAVATALLAGAVQLGRSALNLAQANRGYQPDGLITLRLPMPEPTYSPLRRRQLVTDLLERLSREPGVTEVASANVLPLSSNEAIIAWEGFSAAAGGLRSRASASIRQVTPSYFRALGRRIVEGRPLQESDSATSLPVVVVNRTLARRYLADRAVGLTIPARLDGSRPNWTVVGVVEDLAHGSVTDPPQPEVIVSCNQLAPGQAPLEPGILIRTAGDPEALAPTVRSVLRELDAALAPDRLVTMRRLVNDSLARPRLYSVVLAVFAGCAVIVVAVGLFSALSYAVALRKREVGVRVALGARPRDIALIVGKQALVLAGPGIVLGLAASLALGRTMAGLLYGVGPHDGISMALVSVALLLLVAGVSIPPALRAARLDPQEALKAE